MTNINLIALRIAIINYQRKFLGKIKRHDFTAARKNQEFALLYSFFGAIDCTGFAVVIQIQ